MQTKSLRRLERLRAKLGLKDRIVFDPTIPKGNPSRYRIEDQTSAFPIGDSAQAARCRLKELAAQP